MRKSTLALVITVGITAAAGAQQKPPVSVSEFGKFETLVTPARAGLSPDGKWIAYGINRSNRDNELRIASVAGGDPKTIPFGAQPAFSADSKYAAYAIGYSEVQEEKLREQKKPVHRKVGILTLGSGEIATIDGIETFAFNERGTHLAMKRYAPERTPPPPADAPATNDEPAGATLIVRELATGRDMTFGNVTEYAWQDKGGLLGLVIGAPDKAGNGVQIYDPQSGTLRVLDSAGTIYAGLAWRKESDDLAVLRASTSDKRDGPTHALLAWQHVSSATPRAFVYDPVTAKDFPSDMRTVAFRRPSWSDDGRIVFAGMAKWDEKIPEAAKTNGDGAAAVEEPAGVEVWHARDVDVMPRQKVSARTDRQRSLLAAWHIESNRFVPLGKSFLERVTPLSDQKLAYAVDWTSYAMDRSIGRPAADLFLVDLETGNRTKLQDRIEDQTLQASPGGRYLLYLQADHFYTIDTATRAVTNVTKAIATSFVDREADFTVKQKPPFGVAGWTKNDAAVLLYDKFDIWLVPMDGKAATKLTNGAADQIRHRYVRLDPDEESIDPAKPAFLALFGTWSKQSGYARLNIASGQVERLVLLDKAVERLGKAKDADVFGYVVQDFNDPPDALVGGPSLKDAKTVVSTNAFFADYAWGRGELVEYKNERGDRLQGALFYPAGYEPGKKYPMVVYMYEKLSDGLHRWSSPSPREPYNPAVFTSQGYIFFQPDIVFRPREPGLSVADCVGAAVRKVIAMGVADPARIGIVGHSWGGFDTVYLSTHTKLFAAGVAGAPITNLVSNYGNHHWTSGIAETDHIETGQQRMEVPMWEDLQAYIRNSAVFGVHTMTTPLMVAFGDNDGTVHWHQGVELYNIARRAKKDVVMLVYAGEDHGLRRRPNQLDYQRRILQWFGHYLKGEPAPSWISEGVTFLDREQEVKRAKAKKGS
jgi:dipeptidyl aminopeptidase/acylaminoacyl peptidase